MEVRVSEFLNEDDLAWLQAVLDFLLDVEPEDGELADYVYSLKTRIRDIINADA